MVDNAAHARKIREAFRIFDADDDGVLSEKEGIAALRSVAYLLKTCPTRPEMEAIVADLEAPTEWTIDELEEAFNMLSNEERFTVNPFAFLDPERTGYVEVEALRRALAEMGEPWIHLSRERPVQTCGTALATSQRARRPTGAHSGQKQSCKPLL
jgi:Ca2+-binding EF-hand superfamily protein